MKKLIRTLLIIAIIAGIFYAGYRYFFTGKSFYQSIYLVPANAAVVIETNAVFDAWGQIVHSSAWKTISHIESLAELNKNIQTLDSLISGKMFLLRLIGRRNIMMSFHEYAPGKFDNLYIVNMGKISRLRNPEKIITSLLGKDYPVTKRTYNNQTIYEVFDRNSGEMYIFSFVQDKVIFSTNYKLTEASIDEMDRMTLGRDLQFINVSKRVSGKGLFNVYVNYRYLPSYLKSILGKIPDGMGNLNNELCYSAFSFSITPKGLISIEGYTSVNDTVASFYSSVMESGSGSLKSLEVIPARVASIVKISIENVPDYVKNSLNKINPAEYDNYYQTLKKLEKKFKINVDEHIFSWISDEIVLVQTLPSNLGKNNEFAAIIKARNQKAPEKNLEYVGRQIQRNSPVKIKSIPYNGYTITYISFPGLIKLLFGRMLEKIDKPYYTQINEFVILSNHPQTLKNIIDDYSSGNTLLNSAGYSEFSRQFSRKNNAFGYIDIPVMYDNLKMHVNNETWQNLSRNKPYIIHFPRAGIQINNKDNLLYLTIKAQYEEYVESFSKMRYDSDSFVKLFHFDEPGMDMAKSGPQWYEPGLIIHDLDTRKNRVYYEDGTLQFEFDLKNGLKHGNFREYYPEGSLKVRGKFKDDKPDGTWRLYNEEGRIIEEVAFSAGMIITE